MQTVIIDILNSKAARLLQDLELLQLIRVRRENTELTRSVDWEGKYKGAMQKQPLSTIDNQLTDLRSEWE